LLLVGLTGLIFSAGRRVQAIGSVEAEDAMYGGRTSGGWACGPTGTVRYGGVGAQVTLGARDRNSPKGRGTIVKVAAAGERQSFEVAHLCSGPCDAPSQNVVNPSLLLGARVRAGYAWRYVGVEGGAGVYQAWKRPSATTPSLALYPDVELSFGRLHRLYGVVGLGSPLVTTVLRPGLYAGAGIAGASGLGLDLRTGIFRAGPAVFEWAGYRLDLVGRIPISRADKLSLRLGGSMSVPRLPNVGPLDFEGSVGLAAGY
jgi:hypothetical protein